MVGLPHPTRRKKEGTNLGREHLEELSERRRAFARKKRRGKRAERKSVRKKHKATRARSPLEELTFGTFHVFHFLFLEISLFPSIFCTISAFSLHGEYVVSSFFPKSVFLPCNHGLDFLLMCEFNKKKSVNQKIVQSIVPSTK